MFTSQDEKTGNTALHVLLLDKSDKESIELLINAFSKEELTLKNKDNKTALDIAKATGQNDLAALISQKLSK